MFPTTNSIHHWIFYNTGVLRRLNLIGIPIVSILNQDNHEIIGDSNKENAEFFKKMVFNIYLVQ